MYTQAFTADSKSGAVAHNFCLGCGLCALNCPQGAIVMEEQGVGDAPHAQVRKAPSLRPHLCVHCGRCAAVCSSGTIGQYQLEALAHRVQQEKAKAVAFFCAGLNMGEAVQDAGSVPAQVSLMDLRLAPRRQDVPVPCGMILEEVRCTGRLGARYLLRLVMAGARELVFFPCGGGGSFCQYAKGGTGIDEHVAALQDMLLQYGLEGKVQMRVHRLAAGEALDTYLNVIA